VDNEFVLGEQYVDLLLDFALNLSTNWLYAQMLLVVVYGLN
jgi:hypothetical protein